MMIVFAVAWYAMLLCSCTCASPASGSLALILRRPRAEPQPGADVAVLLHGAGAFRGRVMGMRMLAIYGLPIGLSAPAR